MVYHPNISGKAKSMPVKHHGDGTELGRGVLSALIRRFELPTDIFS